MKTPINTELVHLMPGYDPAKAHQYYEEHKHLKGRKKGLAQPPRQGPAHVRKNSRHAHKNSVRHQQKIALEHSIKQLQGKLGKLEALIKKKEATLRKDQALNKPKARK